MRRPLSQGGSATIDPPELDLAEPVEVEIEDPPRKALDDEPVKREPRYFYGLRGGVRDLNPRQAGCYTGFGLQGERG